MGNSKKSVFKNLIPWIGVFCILFLGFDYVNAQNTPEMAANLKRIADESELNHRVQATKVVEFATRKNIPISFRDSQGNSVLMIGVTADDKPIYIATVNAGAAITTGVVALRTGGGLGLNLEGEGMIAGVWDGGTVRSTHKELKNRIISTVGPTGDDHPSHVTGTIIATGLNPAAKGMAPKAQVKAFYFDNDVSTISTNASSLVLSNHSYGRILGWYFNNNVWTWYGDASVSNTEDYLFGFYSDKARQLDQVAVNAPGYTMVWAAGNERSGNSGNGGHPPDCNSGSGYDCIGVESVAKNLITVGAVNKVPSYSGPESVQMSGFSSWGPTDDGRIKPDLVAAGVNLFSLSAANDSSYTTLSGTSMASPNVTGSLLLLQELYKNLHSGNFMRSSTLKALAIHTAKETGIYPGPDYSYGWGLLDDQAAAKLLLNQNDLDVVVKEYSLASNETFELPIEPRAGEKITATIAWTDPAGVVPPPSLDPTTLSLVNDLDMRIVDDANNQQVPWILDPANPSFQANKGDNFRDNVEKIEFDSPEARPYKIRVKAKNAFANGPQVFSLILTYKSIADSRTKLYWVGGAGNWEDAAHWSLTSGGPSAGVVPDINNRVFFDENSFSAAGASVSINSNVSCYSFTWLTKSATSLSLNSNTLVVDGDINISSSNLLVSSAGNILLAGSVGKQNVLYSSGADLSKVALTVDEADATWIVSGVINVGTLNINSGKFLADGATLNITSVSANSSLTKTLSIKHAVINGLKSLNVKSTNLSMISNEAVINLLPGVAMDPTIITNDGVSIDGKLLSTSGFVKFLGTGNYHSVDLTGTIEFVNSNVLDSVNIGAGSTITLDAGTVQTMSFNTKLSSSSSQLITINSNSLATLNFDGHYRLCFDNLKITNVALSGTAVINAGPASALLNSANWQNTLCENVVLPDFEILDNCIGALTKFNDKSVGTIDTWTWNFGDAANMATSTKQNSFHKYNAAGTYSVTLTVKRGPAVTSYTQSVTVVPNTLSSFDILPNNSTLFCTGVSSVYEWYKNDELIPDETARTYKWDGSSGSFYALIFDDLCNLPSPPVVITSITESRQNFDSKNVVYPNPSKTGDFTVNVPSELLPMQVNVFDVIGNRILTQDITESNQSIRLNENSQGIYVLKLSNGRLLLTYKIEIIK